MSPGWHDLNCTAHDPPLRGREQARFQLDRNATFMEPRPCQILLTGKPWLAYAECVADLFEALAAPARRAILDALSERDGQTLFEICARLSVHHDLTLTRQAVSQHLAALEAVGLLTTRREGRYKYHHLDTTPLGAIVERWLSPRKTVDGKGET